MILTAKQIRGGRAILNWSQNKLADKSGLSTATIEKLESETGKQSPRESTYDQLRVVFEAADLEFTEREGVRLRDTAVRTLEGRESCDQLFDDILRTIRDRGGDIVCELRSPQLMAHIFSYKHGDFGRMKRLNDNVLVKCLVPETIELPLWAKSLRARTIAKKHLAPSSYIAYGPKTALIFADDGNVIFRVMNAMGWTEYFREHFASHWDDALQFSTINTEQDKNNKERLNRSAKSSMRDEEQSVSFCP